MIRLELRPGLTVLADDEDGAIVGSHRWYATPNVMGGFYAAAHPGKTTVYMHRLIMAAPRGRQVDHINHDTLDNRRENLRIVTNRQNNENRNGAYKNSKSGIRGVSPFVANHGTKYWVGRVHTPTVKPMAYFPFTEDGKLAATAWVTAKRAELMTHA